MCKTIQDKMSYIIQEYQGITVDMESDMELCNYYAVTWKQKKKIYLLMIPIVGICNYLFGWQDLNEE